MIRDAQSLTSVHRGAGGSVAGRAVPFRGSVDRFGDGWLTTIRRTRVGVSRYIRRAPKPGAAARARSNTPRWRARTAAALSEGARVPLAIRSSEECFVDDHFKPGSSRIPGSVEREAVVIRQNHDDGVLGIRVLRLLALLGGGDNRNCLTCVTIESGRVASQIAVISMCTVAAGSSDGVKRASSFLRP